MSLAVEQACARVRDELFSDEFASVEAELLASPKRRFPRPLQEARLSPLRAGTKPLLILREDGDDSRVREAVREAVHGREEARGDIAELRSLGEARESAEDSGDDTSAGRRYALKLAPRALLAAEEAVWELRRAARRPAVPARQAVVHVVGRGEMSGLLKPFIELERPELSPDTSTWTELQRAVMLREHAWEWFLDNLDTNTSQYALVGVDAVPVNIDWDRAFATDARSELSRFIKYRPILPNARTFLYSDFVEGKVELPFALLAREARLIRHLPRDEVERVTRTYARARFILPEDVEAFVARVLERRRVIEYEVADFVRALRRERGRLRRPSHGLRAHVVNGAILLWDRWQVLLHRLSRGPLGRASRHALKRARARWAARSAS